MRRLRLMHQVSLSLSLSSVVRPFARPSSLSRVQQTQMFLLSQSRIVQTGPRVRETRQERLRERSCLSFLLLFPLTLSLEKSQVQANDSRSSCGAARETLRSHQHLHQHQQQQGLQAMRFRACFPFHETMICLIFCLLALCSPSLELREAFPCFSFLPSPPVLPPPLCLSLPSSPLVIDIISIFPLTLIGHLSCTRGSEFAREKACKGCCRRKRERERRGAGKRLVGRKEAAATGKGLRQTPLVQKALLTLDNHHRSLV